MLDVVAALLTSSIVLTVTVFWFLYQYHLVEDESPEEYSVPLPDACSRTNELEILESPSIQVMGSTAIQCYCPANGKLLGRVNPATPEGIDRAVEKARTAQIEWAKTTFGQRRKVLKTLLKFILETQDDIVKVACLDSGKTRVDASFGEVLVTVEKLSWTIKHGEMALRPEKRPTNLLMCYKHNEVRYEPLGVVAACVSWNYPFHNLLSTTISALFSGNAILLKASEQTAFSASYFTSIARNALSACEHDPNVVQSISCWPSVAPHLTSHRGVAHITFIGSRTVAHAVAMSAAKALTPLCVELGGKDAAIVLDDVNDADLPSVASILMRGVFQAAGQNCIGIERVVALPRVYAKLLELISPRIRALRVGSPVDDGDEVDIGACISDASFDTLEKLIADAVRRGAKLVHGGTRVVVSKHPQGHFFAPTLLTDVTRDMQLAQRELFAPVFVLMRAKSVEDAVELANSTPYGLGCSVFGNSAKDLKFVTSRVKVGMVSVNDFATYYMCGMPFGGVRGSGYGRFGGEEGLRSLCNLKSVCVDRWSWLGIKTAIPPRLDYKRRDEHAECTKGEEDKAWAFVRGIVDVGYGLGVKQKLKGLMALLKNG